MEESSVKTILTGLRAYLLSNLRIDESFISSLHAGGLLNDSDAGILQSSVSRGVQVQDKLVQYMEWYYDQKMLEKFCMFLDNHSKPAKPLLGQIAEKIRQEMEKHKPGPIHQPGPQQPNGPPSSPPATQGEPTPTVSTKDERSQKIEEIVDKYRSESTKVSLPEIPELQDDFDSIMGDLNAELSFADRKVIYKLKGIIQMKYRRYIHGVKTGKLPHIPDTASGLYEFIAEKSTPYEILFVHHTVGVLDCKDLKGTLQSYEFNLANHLQLTLKSYKTRKLTLPRHEDHTHLALVSKEQTLLSLVLHIKEYFVKYLQLEETIFEGFGEGCTVLFYSILKVDAVLLAPKILSHSAELKRMFDITHLVVFDYFACDLERATIELPNTIHQKDAQLREQNAELKKQHTLLQQKDAQLKQKDAELQHKDEESDHRYAILLLEHQQVQQERDQLRCERDKLLQERSRSLSPEPDQSDMKEESLATVDLEPPPEDVPLTTVLSAQVPDVPQEPEQMTPNEVTTDPEVARLLDMFPGEDSKKLSKLLKKYGGDVILTVQALRSDRPRVPDVPKERKFVFKDFFQEYTDKFLGSVNTHEIAQLLEIEKVIPESLCFELKRTSNDKATEMLYLHMRDYGSLETVHSLCDVMIKKEGYPKMNSLGRDMKKDLPIPKHGELKGECVANEQKENDPENFIYLALHGAATSGNISEFETVVRKCRNMPGFDVDCLLKGCTPLHTAAKYGHVDIVDKLIGLGCGIDKTDDDGLTALHYAALDGHVDVVAKLVEHGCDMNKTNNNGLTILHIAARTGRVDVVAKLFELRFDLNKTDDKGFTALHYAAMNGRMDVIAKLFELGCGMNETDSRGFTALHHAAIFGQVDVIAKLLEFGCDMNKTDKNEVTALHAAAGHGHVDAVAKLVKLNLDMNKTTNNGWTALHLAASDGYVDVVAKLVELGCDVNATDLIRRTALHLAASKGHVKVVTKLIELGCDMARTTNIGGFTALHLAATVGHVDVVAELVRRGTDVNETDTDGMTALHLAAQHGHVNAVTKLIEFKCDRNKTNNRGQTALDIAKAAGHKDIVAKLIMANPF